MVRHSAASGPEPSADKRRQRSVSHAFRPVRAVLVRTRSAARCPAHAPTRVDHNITDPGAGSDPGGSSTTPGSGEVYFENCDAARAAGAAPVDAGDPGYGPHLDRDGDGIACE